MLHVFAKVKFEILFIRNKFLRKTLWIRNISNFLKEIIKISFYVLSSRDCGESEVPMHRGEKNVSLRYVSDNVVVEPCSQ